MQKDIRKNSLKICGIVLALAAGTCTVNAESDAEVLKKYREYFETHDTYDYFWDSGLVSTEWDFVSPTVANYYLVDLDNDLIDELVLQGAAASANSKIGIIDIVDGEAECVYSEWASVMGYYPHPSTGEYELALYEGNGAENFSAIQITLYDTLWNETVLLHINSEDGCWDINRNELSENEAWEIYYEIQNECVEADMYTPLGELGIDGTIEDVMRSLDELISELGGSSASAEENTLTEEQAEAAVIECKKNHNIRRWQHSGLEDENTYVIWAVYGTGFNGKYVVDLVSGEMFEYSPFWGMEAMDDIPIEEIYLGNAFDYLA